MWAGNAQDDDEGDNHPQADKVDQPKPPHRSVQPCMHANAESSAAAASSIRTAGPLLRVKLSAFKGLQEPDVCISQLHAHVRNCYRSGVADQVDGDLEARVAIAGQGLRNIAE